MWASSAGLSLSPLLLPPPPAGQWKREERRGEKRDGAVP